MRRRNLPTRGRRRHVMHATLLAALVAAGLPAAAAAAPPPGKGKDAWTRQAGAPAPTRNGARAEIDAKRLRAYALDRGALARVLAEAPHERDGKADDAALVLELPTPDGSFERFAVVESPVMEPGLAARHPEIRTYAGRGVDDPAATLRADLTPLGFHASVRSPRGGWYVDPYYRGDDSVHASYYARDVHGDHEHEAKEPLGASVDAATAADVAAGPEVVLRTYRLALLSDPSYASYFGAGNVTAAKVTLVNRVTQIYEDESAIRLVLIADNDRLNIDATSAMTGANGPCGGAACFTAAQASGCTSGTLGRNRVVIGQLVGASAYDIGHIIFGLPGGGVASLNSVGGNAKAQGCTGLPNPVGDFFAVDYVAHEMGHQFGGSHTFNGTQGSCSGGNRSAAHSVEPGSGASIMAYAGICRHDNLQPHSDPYWSQRSYEQVSTFVASDRSAINEVQTVSLRDFDGADSFTLRYGGVDTAPIVRGVNYNAAGIKAALETSSGWPVGATATVAPWSGSGTFDDTGFQVSFSGTLAGANLALLELTNADGAGGFVGETAKGGAVDNKGHVIMPTGNRAPVVAAAQVHTIPTRTPFALTGSATDADGDALTYLWEQNDRGGTTGTALVNNTKVNGPLFAQFGTALRMPPYDPQQYESPGGNVVSSDPTRVFPDLAQVLANNTNATTGACPAFTSAWPVPVPAADRDCYAEFLPTSDWVGIAGDRTLHFRLTARDHRAGGGGVGTADTNVVVAPGTGPFLVTSHGATESLRAGSAQAVTWEVAGTDQPPVSTQDVRISLSLDGGWTYPHVLAGSTPNDGAHEVVLPNVASTAARLRIEAVGNVFFDVSATDFEIRDAAAQLAELVEYTRAMGAGASLTRIARAAQAQYADGRATEACDTLSSFLSAVRAQTDKSLSREQADDLTLRARTIRTALDC